MPSARVRPDQSFKSSTIGLIGIGLLAAFAAPQTVARAAEPAATQTVRLVIDFGDGVETHFTRLAWKKGMTVADAIAQTDGRPHGVKIIRIGSGETALVTQIADVKNEGAGRDRRNWLYSLNGKLADIGMGAQTLAPGDVVLWKFDRYDYNGASSQ